MLLSASLEAEEDEKTRWMKLGFRLRFLAAICRALDAIGSIGFWGKGCVFQPGSKIVDLGFVKFKSNGTKAKRP